MTAAVQIQDKHLAFVAEMFAVIEEDLLDATGRQVSLRGIGEPEFLEADKWRKISSRAGWDWRFVIKKERQRSKRIEVAYYCEGVLCALMLARFSRARVSITLRYLEACPTAHPLDGEILTIVGIFTEQFAYAIRAKQIVISNPVTPMIERYRARGYELTKRDQWREARGVKPRCALLIKELPPVFDGEG